MYLSFLNISSGIVTVQPDLKLVESSSRLDIHANPQNVSYNMYLYLYAQYILQQYTPFAKQSR